MQVTCFRLAKAVILGWFAQVDFYTDIQFIYIALLWGANGFAMCAGVIFTFSNLLGQLLFQEGLLWRHLLREHPDAAVVATSFKVRAFEVLHGVLHSHGTRVGFPQIKGSTQLNSVGFYIFLGIKLVGEDVLQALGQIAFTFQYGGSPVVYLSVVTSVCLATYGFWQSGQEAKTWKHKGIFDVKFQRVVD